MHRHRGGTPADTAVVLLRWQVESCFAAFTADLYRLADWLAESEVETVVMESTGVYWIPLFGAGRAGV